MKTVLVTGAKGFISGYLIQELLNHDYSVVGIDNFSKYGNIIKSYDEHPNYVFYAGDAKDADQLFHLLKKYECSHFIMNAAKIGGISYFHALAYDLLSENEKITAAGFDALIKYERAIAVVLSSSMVYENAFMFPTTEFQLKDCPPPSSTYGFQKLAVEYFAKGAYEQYGLKYIIIRPFNCIGIGEYKMVNEKVDGNLKMGMSHVVPDLVLKVIKGQTPLEILGNGAQIRHYTYGGDIARGIRMALENEKALGQDFNISIDVPHTVLEVAKLIWYKVRDDEFKYTTVQPFKYDVQKRIPDVRKAKEVLGFSADTTIEWVLDNEIIPWMRSLS